ncbi:hypothetical protein ACYSNW_16715 [Enterococcus sp. LJL99]
MGETKVKNTFVLSFKTEQTAQNNQNLGNFQTIIHCKERNNCWFVQLLNSKRLFSDLINGGAKAAPTEISSYFSELTAFVPTPSFSLNILKTALQNI